MTDEELCDTLDKIAETRLLLHKIAIELSAIDMEIRRIWQRPAAPSVCKPHSFFSVDDL